MGPPAQSQKLKAMNGTDAPRNSDPAYKAVSLALAVVFAIVGCIFVIFPNSIPEMFNSIAISWGLAPTPAGEPALYWILAGAYMYLVTLLAISMYLHPENRLFAWLLVNGKAASSLLSFSAYLLHQHYLILLTNGVVDGSIGLLVFFLARKVPR